MFLVLFLIRVREGEGADEPVSVEEREREGGERERERHERGGERERDMREEEDRHERENRGGSRFAVALAIVIEESSARQSLEQRKKTALLLASTSSILRISHPLPSQYRPGPNRQETVRGIKSANREPETRRNRNSETDEATGGEGRGERAKIRKSFFNPFPRLQRPNFPALSYETYLCAPPGVGKAKKKKKAGGRRSERETEERLKVSSVFRRRTKDNEKK